MKTFKHFVDDEVAGTYTAVAFLIILGIIAFFLL